MQYFWQQLFHVLVWLHFRLKCLAPSACVYMNYKTAVDYFQKCTVFLLLVLLFVEVNNENIEQMDLQYVVRFCAQQVQQFLPGKLFIGVYFLKKCHTYKPF